MFTRTLKKRATHLATQVYPFLKGKFSVLDIGCGNGMVLEDIGRSFPGMSRVGVDVFRDSGADFPLFVWNGKRLPFGNESFEVVLLFYSLHHTKNPYLLFSEAKRVAKEVLVIETGYKNVFQWLFLCVYDLLVNKLIDMRTPVPFRFRADQSWRKFFACFEMNIVCETPIHSSSLLSSMFLENRLFVLRKNQGSKEKPSVKTSAV